jgi:hypothetical protein
VACLHGCYHAQTLCCDTRQSGFRECSIRREGRMQLDPDASYKRRARMTQHVARFAYPAIAYVSCELTRSLVMREVAGGFDRSDTRKQIPSTLFPAFAAACAQA